MNKLAKYLKPFVVSLLLVVVLLFGQAICDLNLPNFMSNIVNVGIQQSGIEHAAPEAISAQGYQAMRTLMGAEQQALLDAHYAQVAAEEPDARGKTYAARYPAAAGGTLYVRGAANADALAALDAAFGDATATLLGLAQGMAGAQGLPASQPPATDEAGEVPAQTGLDMTSLDLSRLYQAQPLLALLPAQRMEEARASAAQMEPSMRAQAGVALALSFYRELGADVAAMQRAYILRIGALMLLITLAGGAATVLVSLLSSRLSAGVARNLRKALFDKVESFSNTEMDRFSTASLITRCTNDVSQVQIFLTMGVRMICYAPIMCIGGILMALEKSPSMSWIIALAGLVLIGLILVVYSVAVPRFKLMQRLVDKLNLVSRESLSGLMVIRAFGTREHEKARFEEANHNLTATNLFVNRVMALMMPIMMLLMNGVTLLVVWVGAHQVAESALQVGDMMAFMQYAMHVIMSFLMVSMMFVFMPRAAVAATRIAEVLETEPVITDPAEPQTFDAEQKGIVEFRNVCFRYEGAEEDALHDISFTARPGQTTAIIGSTGSGKSTIANLLLRFYDVTQGSVLLDGCDVRQVRQQDLRDRIGYVPQKGVLLSGTIASNLRYGAPEASDARIQEAARVAQAETFIAEKPAGYDDEIAQGGGNVSGGQKQRLSIARALARDPEVYVFDDSFSALDFKTDVTLRRALRESARESTLIIVAQRVSTIMQAEQIIVLDQGRVVGMGTHRELLQRCAEYQEIASSQLSKEELA